MWCCDIEPGESCLKPRHRMAVLAWHSGLSWISEENLLSRETRKPQSFKIKHKVPKLCCFFHMFKQSPAERQARDSSISTLGKERGYVPIPHHEGKLPWPVFRGCSRLPVLRWTTDSDTRCHRCERIKVCFIGFSLDSYNHLRTETNLPHPSSWIEGCGISTKALPPNLKKQIAMVKTWYMTVYCYGMLWSSSRNPHEYVNYYWGTDDHPPIWLYNPTLGYGQIVLAAYATLPLKHP